MNQLSFGASLWNQDPTWGQFREQLERLGRGGAKDGASVTAATLDSGLRSLGRGSSIEDAAAEAGLDAGTLKEEVGRFGTWLGQVNRNLPQLVDVESVTVPLGLETAKAAWRNIFALSAVVPLLGAGFGDTTPSAVGVIDWQLLQRHSRRRGRKATQRFDRRVLSNVVTLWRMQPAMLASVVEPDRRGALPAGAILEAVRFLDRVYGDLVHAVGSYDAFKFKAEEADKAVLLEAATQVAWVDPVRSRRLQQLLRLAVGGNKAAEKMVSALIGGLIGHARDLIGSSGDASDLVLRLADDMGTRVAMWNHYHGDRPEDSDLTAKEVLDKLARRWPRIRRDRDLILNWVEMVAAGTIDYDVLADAVERFLEGDADWDIDLVAAAGGADDVVAKSGTAAAGLIGEVQRLVAAAIDAVQAGEDFDVPNAQGLFAPIADAVAAKDLKALETYRERISSMS